MRLLCFGDSFAAESDISSEQQLNGKPPSWCDLLSKRLVASDLVVRGVRGTGPTELLHQLLTWNNWQQGDIVIMMFSSVGRFCISPYTPGLHFQHYMGDSVGVFDADKSLQQYILKEKTMQETRGAEDLQLINLTSGKWQRLLRAYDMYEAYLNNEYRKDITHRALLLALEGIAANNTQAKFYLKYCFDSEIEQHNKFGIKLNYIKLLAGSAWSMTDEPSGPEGHPAENHTNHFTASTVDNFVEYLYNEVNT